MNIRKLSIITLTLMAVSSSAVFADSISISDPLLVGAKAAAADNAPTVEEMLTYAIQDELLAKAEYNAILDAYGNQRVFSNILRAEETHIALLKPLLSDYAIPVAVEDGLPNPLLPTSLKEAYAIGVQAEIDNIAMYEDFLEKDLPADVKAVFVRLMNASKSHLKAFERNLSRYN